ncbi:hypothetical protein V8G54_001315 [Vigna mungo]|uniref:CASP-like protein n=1 Tax=Vigna mungo TaxID=3915 RepID=A0AAQ3SBE1_VIGMU
MLRACFGLNYHGRMEELPGAFGSSASLALRLGQTVFSTASLLFMCLDVDFYGYTAFWYLFLSFSLFLTLVLSCCSSSSYAQLRVFSYSVTHCFTKFGNFCRFHHAPSSDFLKESDVLWARNMSKGKEGGIVEESHYLVTVMGLVIPWSITLLVVDAYSVFIKCLPLQRRLVMIVFLGDMILSYLSLAAACSTASVTDLLLDADRSYCPAKLCGRYQLSAAMAFLSWFLSSASCLFNFWLFPSL